MKAFQIISLVAILIVASVANAQSPPAADFYVATDGSDETGDGSIDAPYATLDKARERVRDLIHAGLTDDVLVYVRGGKYFLDETLEFISPDSGSANNEIVYSAYPGEVVSFIGGIEVDPAWFGAVSDPDILDRLLEEGRDHVLVADLAANGITDYDIIHRRGFNFFEGPFKDDNPPSGMELFVNGQAMHLARWPNDSYERVAGTPDGEQALRFQYYGDRPERWTQATDVWFYGHWDAFWADCYVPAESIDTATKTVTIRAISQEEEERWGWGEDQAWGGYGLMPDRPFFALNLLEEIDEPGEYYLDRENGKLYVYPVDDIDAGPIYLSTLDTLLRLTDASHIRFENLIFEVSKDNLIEALDVEDVVFHQCLLRNSGTAALAVDGDNSGAEGCEFYGMGDGVVGMDGGDRYQLIEAQNFVTNSRIHDYGRWTRMGSTAMQVWGVGQVMSHNLIHDAPHMAILFKGNEHYIENNEIHNLCWDADDAGTIYVGRDWGARGTEIRHNFFHHINSRLYPRVYGSEFPEHVHAIYFDDTSCGNMAVGNYVYDIDGRAVMIGGGRDNLVENNVLARGRAAIFIDRRGMARTDDQNQSLLNKIEEYNYTQPPWSERYPELATMFDGGTPYEPENNLIAKNMSFRNYFWVEQGAWGSTTMEFLLGVPGSFLIEEDNIERAENPGFVDEDNLDLSLTEDSEAFTIPGFEEIPFDEIGMFPDQPAIYVSAAGRNGSAFKLIGAAEPWAQVASATMGGNDVAESIIIEENGAIRGSITIECADSQAVSLELIVSDPKGHLSPAAVSDEFEVDLPPCPEADDDDSDDDIDDDDAYDDDDDDLGSVDKEDSNDDDGACCG